MYSTNLCIYTREYLNSFSVYLFFDQKRLSIEYLLNSTSGMWLHMCMCVCVMYVCVCDIYMRALDFPSNTSSIRPLECGCTCVCVCVMYVCVCGMWLHMCMCVCDVCVCVWNVAGHVYVCVMYVCVCGMWLHMCMCVCDVCVCVIYA
jgi:hypothetical protein